MSGNILVDRKLLIWQQRGMERVHPLAAYREKQSPPLSQADLARLLGVDRATILRWENGVRKIGRDKINFVHEKTGIPKRDLRPDLAELLEAQ